MPSIVTAAQLRAILGVSNSLYNDAYLEDIIDASENTILPMLVSFEAPIGKARLTDNVAVFETIGIHEFTEGQSVVITGCGSPYNGTRTVLANYLTPYTFAATITNADVEEANIIPSGKGKLTGASTYVGNSSVEAAVLTVAVEIFQSRVAPGGQIEGVDFAATPFRMGRSLFSKCVGLLGAYMDVETLAQ